MAKAKRMDWPQLRALAFGLGLPHVVETTSWGQPVLKAHGKLWAWWSPHEDAAVFKVALAEREILIEAEPERFFCTPHYKAHGLVLMRPEKFDRVWAAANLVKVWRAQAPKRALKAYDAMDERTAREHRRPGVVARTVDRV